MRIRIETLRGGACVLLVVYHVVGSDPTMGLRISDGALRTINDMLALIRMPLFAMIAGWVYAFKPIEPGSMRNFLRAKAKRLLVPMVCVGSIFIVTQSLTPGTNAVYSGIPFVQPVAHFWFVEAIFLIFVLVAALDAAGMLDTLRKLAVASAIASAAYFHGSPLQIFASGGAIYLLPFFLLGLGLGRFREVLALLHRPLIQAALVVFVIFQLGVLDVRADRQSLASLLAGTSLCALAIGSNFRNNLLTLIAKYSFAIYLFHVFFTAGVRIGLEQAGVANLTIHVTAGVAAGIVGPAVLQVWLRRHPVADCLLLGRPLPEEAPLPKWLGSFLDLARARGRGF